MHRMCGLLAALILLAAASAQATTVYVDVAGGGDFATIGEGMAAASDGDTVLVAPGLYVGPMNRDLQLTTKELVVMSSHGSEDTIIDCQNAGRGFYLLLILNTSPTISGFTIRNGSIPAGYGGAILCSHGTPTFTDLHITNNHAQYGGGFYCDTSAPTLHNVTFVSNVADSLGGGMACMYSGDATLTNVGFIDNVAGAFGVPESNDAGGGMYVSRSDVSLTNVSFEGNYAGHFGGGLCCDGTWEALPTNMNLSGVTFSDNGSPYGAGAWFLGASASLDDLLVAGNTSTGNGGGLVVVDAQDAFTISYASFRDNMAGGAGGGLYVNETIAGMMTVTDSEFLRNSAPNDYGGGAYIRNSLPTFTHSTFVENTAQKGGGAMVHCSLSDPVFSYCTFAWNEATVEGSGVYSETQCSAALENTIIAFGEGGGSVGCGPDATLLFYCSDIYGNAGGDWISCVASQYGTYNNFSEDPLFCGEALPWDPLSLHSDSPCAPWMNPACGQVGARPVGCHFPEFEVSPPSLEFVVGPNQKSCQELTLLNPGDGQLVWQLGVQRTGRVQEEAPAHGEVAGTAAAANRTPSKYEIDDAVGAPVLRGWGGPDAGGYVWTDSDEPGGPTFDWQDISTVGTEIFLDDDDYAGAYLPFAFPFYGEPKWFVNICSNGLLAFGPLGPQHYINRPIPTPGSTDNLVAPFWEDLNPEFPSAAIHHHYDEGTDRFIVQYTDVPHFDGSGEGLYTFQVILRPDGTILCQYLDMQGTLDSATVGVETGDAPPIGLEVVYDAPYVHDGLAVEIAPWITACPPSGVVEAGGVQTLEVCVRSTGLGPSEFLEAVLWFATNDPDNAEAAVPVSMLISETGVEEEELSDVPVFRGIHPNPFNPSTQIAYDLPRSARVSVTVYDVAGRLVRVIRDDVPTEAGSHAEAWDGMNNSGARLASGVYLCRLEVDGEVFSRRMVLLK